MWWFFWSRWQSKCLAFWVRAISMAIKMHAFNRINGLCLSVCLWMRWILDFDFWTSNFFFFFDIWVIWFSFQIKCLRFFFWVLFFFMLFSSTNVWWEIDPPTSKKVEVVPFIGLCWVGLTDFFKLKGIGKLGYVK